jgi:riboflavin synthase alpha subunit
MKHEPTEDELTAAEVRYWHYGAATIKDAITASNAIRDKRIRNEALEEAAQVADELDGHRHRDIAASIRALKDKPDGDRWEP